MSFGRPATPFAENKYSTRAWDKQMQFVREYLRDPNAARAARRAGFKDAKQEGRRLLQTPWIGDLITRGIDRRWRHARVDPDDVILELKRVGFANIWNYLRLKEDGSVDLDFSALTKDSAAGIIRITVEYGQDKTPHKRKRKAKEENGEPTKRQGRKPVIVPGQQIRKITIQLADKLRALELLGKTKNMFSEPEDETRPSNPSATIDAIIERFAFDQRSPQELEALLVKVRSEESPPGNPSRDREGALPHATPLVDAAHAQPFSNCRQVLELIHSEKTRS